MQEISLRDSLRPSLSRQIFQTERVTTSRGKGNKFHIDNNKFVKGQTDIKTMWHLWKEKNVRKVKKELEGDNSFEVLCPDCLKMISRRTYLNHRTKNGCSKLHPWVRYKNFAKDNNEGVSAE